MSATVQAPVEQLSFSRVRVIDQCELAYDYRYIRKVPAAARRAATVFGSVVHQGVQDWYELPGDGYREKIPGALLADLVAVRWQQHLPPLVWTALRQSLQNQRELRAVEQAIRLGRPQIKAPTQTKDYIGSDAFKRSQDLREALLAECGKVQDMAWPKDEDPLKAYNKSMAIADDLQRRWEWRPKPLVVERYFTLEFGGVEIRGYIDQIRVDPDPLGQVLPELLDLKTGRQALTQMEAFLQAFLYNEAAYLDPELPEPDHITFWLARHNRPQHGHVDRARHQPLAERIVTAAKRKIEQMSGSPSYGMWCKSCDYADLCAQEIGLWPLEQDTAVLGAE